MNDKPYITELEKRLAAARFYAKERLNDIRQKEAELNVVKLENKALRGDLNEYREILCNKQKQLDVVTAERDMYKAQAIQAREFAEKIMGV